MTREGLTVCGLNMKLTWFLRGRFLSSCLPMHTSEVLCSTHAFELYTSLEMYVLCPFYLSCKPQNLQKNGTQMWISFSLQLLFPNILCPNKYLVCYNQDLYRSAGRSSFSDLNKIEIVSYFFISGFKICFKKVNLAVCVL